MIPHPDPCFAAGSDKLLGRLQKKFMEKLTPPFRIRHWDGTLLRVPIATPTGGVAMLSGMTFGSRNKRVDRPQGEFPHAVGTE